MSSSEIQKVLFANLKVLSTNAEIVIAVDWMLMGTTEASLLVGRSKTAIDIFESAFVHF